MKYIAILGAPDPEMEAIDSLLRECGVEVHYAQYCGARVTQATAYKAERPEQFTDDWLEKWKGFLCIECAWAEIDEESMMHVIDHHRPGSFGSNTPPAKFMVGSSIGQVIRWLAREELLQKSDKWTGVPRGNGWGAKGLINFWDDGTWRVHVGTSIAGDIYAPIPKEFVYIAAADHCITAAYGKSCPGIDSDEFLSWRTRELGTFWTCESEIRERITEARRALMSATFVYLKFHDVYTDAGTTNVCVQFARDMRGAQSLLASKELAEAAAMTGETYIEGPIVGIDGRRKIICRGNPGAGAVEDFMNSWAPANGLVEIYGDPNLGFAGGYEV